MKPQHKLFISKPPKLNLSDNFWSGCRPFEVCRILGCDYQRSNEFVIAEYILVWITKNDGAVLYNEHIPGSGQLFRPCSSMYNRDYADEVIRCLRPLGLSLFYNYFVMIPWLNKLGIRYRELECMDYSGLSSDEEISESSLYTHARKTKQRRVIGHTSTTLLPPDVLNLKPGEYVVEEPCMYCGDESDDESNDANPRPMSLVKIKIKVDPENSSQPVTISGKCHSTDGRQDFYHHIVEHCVIDPSLSIEVNEEFVSLYCTSYMTLIQHFAKLKKARQDDVKVIVFYSME